ncbi:MULTISPECIES: muramoyltetrapeptide carboxypeptidase [Oleiagrimonas]|uniref:Muramoyltetrapeptide carboxypeptidase n=1 Tax=Oleiagrimonas citrea TaxID=1665687 RepID=A0A846ZJL7_9GAMM|nr:MULTISPECIES: muramoyltetrapeptide carboxypeptidase [Oleiagrimonas]NKZ38186.1 muramoyltetrapeptide carboxypeptidase [Oleiagrimonas citrea]RAP58498.1 muramoyltetrapeptide carboxypeptidase [Oleiagrimonas sp. MCCC 1A03011]
MTSSLTIQLVAPSGFADPQAVQRGVERLQRAGHRVLGAESGLRRYLRFAGTDSVRAEEINRLGDPGVPLPDIVMAVRGGYGAHRILPHLDYDALRARLAGSLCALVGHSDFTAISLALNARSDVVSFAGPMLAYDFGGQSTSGFTLEHFWNTVRAPSRKVHWDTHADAGIDVHGMLWGGNLAVVCSLLGTPYMPEVDNGILFIEDVFEPVYRIERLLYQLKLSGVLDSQRAVVLGEFSGYRGDEYDPAYDLRAVVNHLRSITHVPVISGLPFGHRRDKLTLPVGSRSRLRIREGGRAELAFSGYPYVAAAEPVAQSAS